eukprot:4547745-Prymnesium_polylepis.1
MHRSGRLRVGVAHPQNVGFVYHVCELLTPCLVRMLNEPFTQRACRGLTGRKITVRSPSETLFRRVQLRAAAPYGAGCRATRRARATSSRRC